MEASIKRGGKDVTGADEFHIAIYQGSKNIVLYKIGRLLHELMHENRKITLQIPGRAAKSLKDHVEIFEAIKNKDAASTAKRIEKHLSEVARARSLK